MYVTRQRLTTYLATAELGEVDAPLAGKVRLLVAHINQQGGFIDETDQAAVDAAASAIGETRSQTYKVARLAEAAGLLVKVS